jgi:hypothetical protein
MADVEDRQAPGSERCQQFDDARHGLRIVAPLARGLPFIEGALHVNDDEGGVG